MRKLGIKAGGSVLLDGAPPGFELSELPDAVTLGKRTSSGPYDVIVCFCPDHAHLAARWPVLHPLTAAAGALWIASPRRRGSGVPAGPNDLTENVVRDFALGHGRVDVKVCAMDDAWSALKHVTRKADR